MRLFSSAYTSLAVEPSGPGVPELRFWWARMLVSRAASASTHSCMTRSRSVAEPPVRRQVSTRCPIAPELRGTTVAPMATRSFISVVSATFHPSPRSPMRLASGMRTSVM